MRKQLLLATILSVVAVVLIYQVNPNRHNYDTALWPNVVAHFIGGAAIAFGALWLAVALGVFPKRGEQTARVWGVELRYMSGVPMKLTLLIALIAVIVAGLGWEVYEVIRWTWVGVRFTEAHIIDTILDLVINTLGALVAWAVAHRYWVS